MASCGESLRRDERFAEASALAGPEPDRVGLEQASGSSYRHPHRVWPSRAHWAGLNVPVVGSLPASLAYGFLQPGDMSVLPSTPCGERFLSALYTWIPRGEIKTLLERMPLGRWLCGSAN